MGSESGSGTPGATLATTAIACAALAAVALVILAGSGRPGAGLALAAGLLIGSVNGHLARAALALDASFRATSLGRLAVLSAAALGFGLLLGWETAWIAVLGVAAAQMVLAAAAALQAVRA